MALTPDNLGPTTPTTQLPGRKAVAHSIESKQFTFISPQRTLPLPPLIPLTFAAGLAVPAWRVWADGDAFPDGFLWPHLDFIPDVERENYDCHDERTDRRCRSPGYRGRGERLGRSSSWNPNASDAVDCSASRRTQQGLPHHQLVQREVVLCHS